MTNKAVRLWEHGDPNWSAAGAVSVDQAYRYCAELASRHYENFTVISWFVPSRLRPALAAIYAYCRGVDDLGDEWQGDRLAALDWWTEELDRAYRGHPTHPVFVALSDVLRQHPLPREEFEKLVEANRRDQVVTRYETIEDLYDYCRHSADPVGRLVLSLFGYHDPERKRLSDHICTALQLVNFLQDLGPDLARGRLYLPMQDLRRFGVDPDALLAGRPIDESRLAQAVAFEASRAQALFAAGAGLEAQVNWRLGRQLRLYRLGGLGILQGLAAIGYNSLRRRPTLSRVQKFSLAVGVLFGRTDAPPPRR